MLRGARVGARCAERWQDRSDREVARCRGRANAQSEEYLTHDRTLLRRCETPASVRAECRTHSDLWRWSENGEKIEITWRHFVSATSSSTSQRMNCVIA